MADIFLSYSAQDADRIAPLLAALEGQGWSVWWDRKIKPGKTFYQVIEEELAKARCVVVLWSRDSVQSQWVKDEAEEGKKRGVLAPALIDDVTIPFGFRTIEAAKLYEWRGASSHPELELLLSAIGDILGTVPSPVRRHGFASRLTSTLNRNKLIIALLCAALLSTFMLTLRTVRDYFTAPSPPPSPSPSHVLAPSPSPPAGSPAPSPTAAPPSPTPAPSPSQPAATPQPDARGEDRGLALRKVVGDGQVIPLSKYELFFVIVVDADGRPVKGAKVAWQTPAGGPKKYIGETDDLGVSSATNLYTFSNPGTYEQTAVLVSGNTPLGFTDGSVVPLGAAVTFTFRQQ